MQELKNIEWNGDTLAVGAVCVHSQVAQSPVVRQYFSALAMACSQVGCAQIRNRGTLGGSIGTSSPAGDVYPPLLALCGAAEVMNSRGAVRTIPARELVLGKGKTALASDEAILRFLLPLPAEHEISAFDKIDVEAPYHALTNAGHISYVELDGDPTENLDAFEAVVRHMKEAGIGYGSVNHPVDRDPVCGYNGIIGDTCPRCGRRETPDQPFERIRRITGYLVGTLDRFNNGKRAEERDRVKHGVTD